MKPSTHSPESIIRDIDKVLLEESELLEALKIAVHYNSLEPAEAEQIMADFHAENCIIPRPDFL